MFFGVFYTAVAMLVDDPDSPYKNKTFEAAAEAGPEPEPTQLLNTYNVTIEFDGDISSKELFEMHSNVKSHEDYFENSQKADYVIEEISEDILEEKLNNDSTIIKYNITNRGDEK